MMNRHGSLATEYWRTYRPAALAELGTPAQQEEFFTGLGLRVMAQIGELTEQMLEQLPVDQRSATRATVRAQATEVVYEQEVYLPKEPGTEEREM